MSSGYIILFELVLVLGVALVFGVRELRNLRRYDRERAERTRLAENTSGTSSAKPRSTAGTNETPRD